MNLIQSTRALRSKGPRAFALPCFLMATLATPTAVYADCGSEDNPTGDPIGGGSGYSRAVERDDADIIVSGRGDFLSALATAWQGEVIYIDDSAEIDLTGLSGIEIPGGVTLCSGRGSNGSEGALLFARGVRPFSTSQALFRITGPNVRVTGLRIRGPDPHVGVSAYGLCSDRWPAPEGIACSGHENLEIDDCELWGWSHASIQLANARRAFIHHNYIHHNLRWGLGYGIAHDSASTSVIEANLFNANRHSIAGTGREGQCYEARYNTVGPCVTGHVFDMHGGQDWDPPDWECAAGDTILIHHNTFQVACSPSVMIRGDPRFGAFVFSNRTAFEPVAFKQTLDLRCLVPAMNFHAYDNCYDSSLPCTCDLNGQDLIDGFCDAGSWATAGNDPDSMWYVGDFTGDGADDVARWGPLTGIEVLRSTRISFEPPEPWTAPLESSDWIAGDFNGDGREDLAQRRQGGGFDVLLSSGSAFGAPQVWTTEDHPGIRQVLAGDFDGDHRADLAMVIRIGFGVQNDGVWILLSAGAAFLPGERWAGAIYGADDWRVGDFDGDGRSDIVRSVRTTWNPSCGISEGSGANVFLSTGRDFSDHGSWCNVEIDVDYPCVNSRPSRRWYVGDYDGDGDSDLFRSLTGFSGAEVFLSDAEGEFLYAMNWTDAECGDQGWYVGDYDGDGREDVLRCLPNEGYGADVFLSCYATTARVAEGVTPESDGLLVTANPNPSRGRVSFTLHMVAAASVRLDVYGVGGERVARVLDAWVGPGEHTVDWDGGDASGAPAASGVFFARYSVGSRDGTLRFVRLVP